MKTSDGCKRPTNPCNSWQHTPPHSVLARNLPNFFLIKVATSFSILLFVIASFAQSVTCYNRLWWVGRNGGMPVPMICDGAVRLA